MIIADVEAPMHYRAENGNNFAIMVLDITKYPLEPKVPSSTLTPQGEAMLTWRWVRHPSADLNEIHTDQYKLAKRFPYVADVYVVEELP